MAGSNPSADADREFDRLVECARNGDQQAAGQLIAECRDYLLVIANKDLDRNLRGKIGASDLVQESMLAAQANIQNFRGNSKNEFVGWLRGILINQLRETRRHYKGMQKRQVDRERALNDSRAAVPDISDSLFTPGTQLARDEEARLLSEAMNQLSEEYQTVIRLRNWERLSFEEIGKQMNRTSEAARKLWARALYKLEQELH